MSCPPVILGVIRKTLIIPRPRTTDVLTAFSASSGIVLEDTSTVVGISEEVEHEYKDSS
jgi:hypothetical protein